MRVADRGHRNEAAPRRCFTAMKGDGPSRRLSPAASGADRDALFLEELLQIPGLEHLPHDVAAADELAVDVKLRDCRPVREFLDALAHRRVRENVDAFEL